MIATRLQSSSTSFIRWLESSTVMPLSASVADERAHVAHAGRVEPGRRLVQEQEAGAADQRPGDAEALAHAVRVAADAVLGPAGEIDGVERRVDLRARVAAVERRDELEVLAAREVGVEARRLDEARDALERAHAVDHRVAPEEPRAAAARADQPEQHAQRRRLARAVGPEVAVDVARLDGQVDVVDRRDLAVGLDEAARLDDGASRQHRPQRGLGRVRRQRADAACS